MKHLADLTPDQLRAVAVKIPTSVRYLQHIVAGRRTPSVDMAVAIENATRGAVPRESFASLPCARCKYLKSCKGGK
jgi:hypothetical protein